MRLERLLAAVSVEAGHAPGDQGEPADSDEELLERRPRLEVGV
jgi:hypothetical protein